MDFSPYILITTACLLVVQRTVQCTVLSSVPDDTITSTSGINVADNTSSTLNGYKTTEYAIIDFAKLGYELFKKELFNALAMFDNFMEMNPMVVKITKTYIFGNLTDSSDNKNSSLSGVINSSLGLQNVRLLSDMTPIETDTIANTAENESEYPPSQNEIFKHLETNTESPHMYKGSTLSQQTNVKYKANNEIINDDINNGLQKTEEETEGVVGKVIGAVGHFFKGIWNWITG